MEECPKCKRVFSQITSYPFITILEVNQFPIPSDFTLPVSERVKDIPQNVLDKFLSSSNTRLPPGPKWRVEEGEINIDGWQYNIRRIRDNFFEFDFKEKRNPGYRRDCDDAGNSEDPDKTYNQFLEITKNGPVELLVKRDSLFYLKDGKEVEFYFYPKELAKDAKEKGLDKIILSKKEHPFECSRQKEDARDLVEPYINQYIAELKKKIGKTIPRTGMKPSFSKSIDNMNLPIEHYRFSFDYDDAKLSPREASISIVKWDEGERIANLKYKGILCD